MDTITIDARFPALVETLAEFERQTDFVIAGALTGAAFAAQKAWPGIVREKVDKPNRFTENALYVVKATKRTLRAEVGVKSLQAAYLAPLFRGGNRERKTIEQLGGYPLAVPSSLQRLNRFGNVARRRYTEIFRQAKQRGGKYVLNPEGYDRGIYERTRRGLKPLFFFVDRAQYEAVLSIQRDLVPVIRRELPRSLERSLEFALRTARKKGETKRRRR